MNGGDRNYFARALASWKGYTVSTKEPFVEYDKDGKILSVTYYDENGKVSSVHQYAYDENGNRLSQTKYDGNGNVIEGNT